jgi:hypothetical protein
MTSERTRAGFEFACDKCGEVREPGKLGLGSARRDFKEEWADAKEEGWRATQGRPGEWKHYCPDC